MQGVSYYIGLFIRLICLNLLLFSWQIIKGDVLAADHIFSGSGVNASLDQIPSAFWPQYVSTLREISPSLSKGKVIPSGVRGTLQRCEANEIVVDFGRFGITKLKPELTDFYEQMLDLIKGRKKKEYPNLTIQIGNKLMTFDPDQGKPGPIDFEFVRNSGVFVLLYLDTYNVEDAPYLNRLGDAYTSLRAAYPSITGVIMARERSIYDFAFTIGYSIPLIAPHFREGYIKSFAHLPSYPELIMVDANGRVLYRSGKVAIDGLVDELELAIQKASFSWTYEADLKN